MKVAKAVAGGAAWDLGETDRTREEGKRKELSEPLGHLPVSPTCRALHRTPGLIGLGATGSSVTTVPLAAHRPQRKLISNQHLSAPISASKALISCAMGNAWLLSLN